MSAELRPWELIRSDLVLQRPPWFAVYQDMVRLPSGRVLDDFYRVVLTDYAMVAAVTPDGRLVMVRGYKHGLGRVSLAAPAGFVEAGEPPLQAAQRELWEETGYKAPDWQLLGSFLTDGNRHCGTGHLFLARGAVPDAAARHSDDAEELRVELVTPAQFLQAVREGDVGLLPSVAVIALALAGGEAGLVQQ